MGNETKAIVPRSDLQICRIGKKTILVDCSAENIDTTDVYSMNETAVWMWQKVNKKPCTAETLTTEMCAIFDVSQSQARKDIDIQLKEWEEMGLIDMLS